MTRITAVDVETMRNLHSAGRTLKAIAALYEVSESYVCLIVNHKRRTDDTLLVSGPIYLHEDGRLYGWIASNTPAMLYGKVIQRASTIPDGMTMILRNGAGEELRLRGEMYGDQIVFIHLEGEGGSLEIGRWEVLS